MRHSVERRVLVLGLSVLSALAMTVGRAVAQDPNSFNRLHSAAGDRNAPPARDGLHDPAVDGTGQLQSPREAFEALPKAVGGNFVNWGEALKNKKISPRWDKSNPGAQSESLDLDVVREVKGTTPDAVFPHAVHAEWVECASCHPEVFEPTKGANSMTMAEIMAGKKCGICHGTVAFPVSDCKGCHYKQKSGSTAKASGSKSGSGRKK